MAMRIPFQNFFAGKWGVAAIAGGTAFILVIAVFLVLRPAPQFQSYLAIKGNKNLTRGQALTEDMITSIRLPADNALSVRAIRDTPDDRLNVRDRRVSRDLGGGTLLLYQDFTEVGTGIAERIDPNLRAMSIPVSASSAVAHMIEPGSLVDVLAVVDGALPQPEPGKPVTSQKPDPVARTVLQGVKVLAVGALSSPSPYVNVSERGYSTVTLALTPAQVALTVETLTLARGNLVLALRNPKAVCPCEPVADVTPAAVGAAGPKAR